MSKLKSHFFQITITPATTVLVQISQDLSFKYNSNGIHTFFLRLLVPKLFKPMLGKLEIQLASSDEKCNFFQLTFFGLILKLQVEKRLVYIKVYIYICLLGTDHK